MAEGNEASGGQGESRVAQVAGAIVLALLVMGAVFAIVGIYPHKIPTPNNPSFVDDIFDSRIVVLFVRIALMFAAGYVVISVVGLIISRRWLAELGPFKASDPIARLDSSAEDLEKQLEDAVRTIQDLEGRLIESDEALTEGQADIQFLLDHIDTMEKNQEGT